ncbi:MAG: hypothetical protein GY889_14085 [Proteobacteria bacterium]|jgi:hypothetical protein|nr:hypothetical protein [Pseudomonadota bacterium]MDP6950458.1 nitrate reductase associated protein [Arenicellales bacterium]HJP06425.1 nitrate reductase associated protein [Arenicellales bacterium]|tara:strand:+ start:7383 stop:7841 length:459 start_codon:yes stop_codon:yes gene_type:complete
MEQVFTFERTIDPQDHFIPLVVRMKLDLAGARIHLADWQALADEDRQFLVELEIADPAQGRHYFNALRELLAAANRGMIEQSDPVTEAATDWLKETEPEPITQFKARAGIRGDWQALTRFQRYLLCHAARKDDVTLNQQIIAEVPALQFSQS